LCGFASCEIQKETPPLCDAGITFVPLVRIEPGGRFTESWNGLAAVERRMPEICYAGTAQSSCAQMLEPVPGAYRVAAAARTECAQCNCTPSTSGFCLVPAGFYDAGLGGQALEARVEVSLPAGPEIALAFD